MGYMRLCGEQLIVVSAPHKPSRLTISRAVPAYFLYPTYNILFLLLPSFLSQSYTSLLLFLLDLSISLSLFQHFLFSSSSYFPPPRFLSIQPELCHSPKELFPLISPPLSVCFYNFCPAVLPASSNLPGIILLIFIFCSTLNFHSTTCLHQLRDGNSPASIPLLRASQGI